MAKSAPRSGATGSSKIRFIMLEADLNDGDLSQITQAISSALGRGNGGQQKPLAALNGVVVNGNAGAEGDGTDTNTDSDVLGEQIVNAPPPPRNLRPRKFPTPKVLGDADLNSGSTPFETFAKQKAPDTDVTRYLLVAYWFKHHRNVDQVNIDHAFTCYKKMGWGTNIKDFSKPFYNLRTSGRGEMKDGFFKINHIGEDVIEKLPKKP